MSGFSKDELKRKRVGVLFGGLSSERERPEKSLLRACDRHDHLL